METGRIAKVSKSKKTEAEKIFKMFCVSANPVNNEAEEDIIIYQIGGMLCFIACFFSNAVDKRGFIKTNARPRFV